MKRFLIIIGLLFTLLASNLSFADNLDDVFRMGSCNELRSQLIAVANSESLDRIDFNYISALECNMSVLQQNMIVKMLYMMFGDFVLKSIELTLGLGSLFVGEDINFYDAAQTEVKNSVEHFQVISSIIQGLSYLTCVIVLVLASVFYLYYLFNTAHDGSFFGKGYNLFWTSTRLAVTIFLVVPITSFNDYTAVQVIVIMAATIGTLLANVVWFIMPVFEYLYMDDVQEIKEKNEIPNKMVISEMIDNNIKMHVCDIQARKGIYLYGLDIKDMTQKNIEGSKFGSCLQDKKQNMFRDSGSTTTGIPSEIINTKQCALADNYEKRISVDCGVISFQNDILTAGIITPIAYMNDYQGELRQVAYNLIGRYCVDRKLPLNETDEIAYIKECARVLNADSLSYEPRYGEQIISVYKEAPNSSAISESINSLKNRLYETMASNSESIVKTDINSKEVSDKIALSLIKGWMSASSFVLDLGSEYKNREIKYNEVFSAIKSIATNQISSSDNVGGGINSAYSRSKLDRDITQSNRDLYDYIDSLSSSQGFVPNTDDGISWMMKAFFPGIVELKDFNGNKDLISSRATPDSCQEDFNNCAKVTLNPLVKMIRLGSDMATIGFSVAAASFIVNSTFSWLSGYYDSTTFAYIANVSDMFSYLFIGYGLLGILIAYLPAIIIFAFFIGNAFGWFIIVVQMIVIAQLWVLMHLFPNRDLGFAGKAASGYKMLIDIILRPAFIVFGAFVTFLMMSIMIALLNVLFGIVLNTFVFFTNPTSVIEFITNYIIHLVYLVMVLVIMYRSAKAMYKIPNALMNWFDMHNYEDSNVWNEITGKMQTLVMQDLRRIMLLT